MCVSFAPGLTPREVATVSSWWGVRPYGEFLGLGPVFGDALFWSDRALEWARRAAMTGLCPTC